MSVDLNLGSAEDDLRFFVTIHENVAGMEVPTHSTDDENTKAFIKGLCEKARDSEARSLLGPPNSQQAEKIALSSINTFSPVGCKYIVSIVGASPRRSLVTHNDFVRSSLGAVKENLLMLRGQQINVVNVLTVLFTRWQIHNYYRHFRDSHVASLVNMLVEDRPIDDLLAEINNGMDGVEIADILDHKVVMNENGSPLAKQDMSTDITAPTNKFRPHILKLSDQFGIQEMLERALADVGSSEKVDVTLE